VTAPQTTTPGLAGLIAGQSRRLRVGALVSTVAGFVWIAQAAVVAVAVDRLAGGQAGNPLAATVWPAIGFVCLAILRAGLEAFGSGLARAAARRVVASARGALAGRMARDSAFDTARLPSGAVAALAADKLEALVPYLTRYRTARLRAAVLPLALVIAVAWESWVAALVLLVAGPLIPLFMALVGMAAKEASEKQMDEIGTMNALMLDRLRAIVDIRLLGAVDHVARDFDRSAGRLRAKTMAVLRIAFLSSAVLELFSALGVAMVAVYVGFALLGILTFGAWSQPLTLAGGLFALMLAPDFFQPLRDFAAAWHDKAAADAVTREFDAAMVEAAAPILGRGDAVAPLSGPADIALDGLRYKTVSLDGHHAIPPGTTVAVTGPSGVGKSTVLAMIAGLLRPDAGSVRVAGEPLDDGTADAWRARVAWVGQRPVFIAGSVRANVALTGDPTDRAGIDRALALAAAETVVETLPRGLDARLGETGHGISGGEARRLGVARAAFAGRDVILADEPTADLDAETAEAVTEGLLQLAADGATLIVATHDRALAGRMDVRIALGEQDGDGA